MSEPFLTGVVNGGISYAGETGSGVNGFLFLFNAQDFLLYVLLRFHFSMMLLVISSHSILPHVPSSAQF